METLDEISVAVVTNPAEISSVHAGEELFRFVQENVWVTPLAQANDAVAERSGMGATGEENMIMGSVHDATRRAGAVREITGQVLVTGQSGALDESMPHHRPFPSETSQCDRFSGAHILASASDTRKCQLWFGFGGSDCSVVMPPRGDR
ncbi:hypothetical protein [uncultured Jatrophihabitans sp.]|uniref:hypothetical protein n=1 Tax=uncultured Jatrophihabitans sp. TaxID=1610747 RepID=UPI0035C95A3B